MIISEHLIDGIAPERVVTPTNDEEIAEILTRATDGDWVLPTGGGTALTTGNAVDYVPLLMDLSSISGVIEYEPADLTVSVRAGTRWSELIATLAEQGQTVPLDVPVPDKATVGGIVATGWAGPRRLRDGTIKDLLIGASFVRGDGLAAKAGGMVVKNVSGFEIPRLLHGSYGSLAVITSVNLKVVPSHDAEMTLRFRAVAFYDTVQEVLELTRAEPSVAAAVVDGSEAKGDVSIRLSGRQNPIRELARKLQSGFQGGSFEDILEDADSVAFWQQRSDELATARDDRVVIEVGCQPADVAGIVGALKEGLAAISEPRYAVSPGTGSVVLSLPAREWGWPDWQRCWAQSGAGSCARFLLLHAPRSWRSGNQVWSIPEGQGTIMAALKRQFDPAHSLNRGRLWDPVPDARASDIRE